MLLCGTLPRITPQADHIQEHVTSDNTHLGLVIAK